MGVLIQVTNGSHNALIEAGLKIKRKKPKYYWADRQRRIGFIKKLVLSLNIPAEEVTWEHFIGAKLYSLLAYYNNSPIKALLDAGYKLSPEIIKKRKKLNGKKIYLSNHGHKFMSIFERDIDNWIWNKGIEEHRHDVPYPESKLNCDFLIGDYWIEAAGLLGNRWYDKVIKEKKRIAKEHDLKLIVITMDDFYRKKVIERKLVDVLREHGTEYNEKLTSFA